MRVVLFHLVLLVGCGDGETAPDAGVMTDAGAVTDGAAVPDTGPGMDAAMDGGVDAGVAPDAAADASVYDGPLLLSESGLYADLASRTLADGVMPYAVTVSVWTDGHDKSRYLMLPAGSVINTADMDGWLFPIGTRAFMEVRSPTGPMETRMLEKRSDDGPYGWLVVGFEWRADGSDADARPLGAEDVGGTSYDIVPSTECLKCHLGSADVLNGVSALQLSDPGGFLEELLSAELLSDPPTTPVAWPGTGVTRDALAYMHANCGQCHNDAHPLAGWRKLRLDLSVTDSAVMDTPAYRTAIGARMSHELMGGWVGIVPGSPAESQLYQRMELRDLFAMPPLASETADEAAIATVGEWITSLAR